MVAMLVFNVVMFVVSFAILALQQYLPLNPDGKGAHRRRPDLQHRRLVHLQHQPAALFRRGVDELPLAARRADVAAVRVGGDRHRRAGGARARAGRPAARQLLRRPAARLVPGPAAGRARRRDPACSRRDADDLRGRGAWQRRWKASQQTIARGPVAAFVAIKQIGTNGGGFFGPNSTHPFENPSFWTNARRDGLDHPDPDGLRVDVRPDHRAHAPRGGGLRRDAGA